MWAKRLLQYLINRPAGILNKYILNSLFWNSTIQFQFNLNSRCDLQKGSPQDLHGTGCATSPPFFRDPYFSYSCAKIAQLNTSMTYIRHGPNGNWLKFTLNTDWRECWTFCCQVLSITKWWWYCSPFFAPAYVFNVYHLAEHILVNSQLSSAKLQESNKSPGAPSSPSS